MKKLIAISIAAILVLGISVSLYAEDDTMDINKTITISLDVSGENFGFQIWPEEYDLSMPCG